MSDRYTVEDWPENSREYLPDDFGYWICEIEPESAACARARIGLALAELPIAIGDYLLAVIPDLAATLIRTAARGFRR